MTNLSQFAIQSDFITQASREDIFDSQWNQAPRQGVAETFRDAALSLCQNPELRYTWMRYLPAESIADDFWRQLRAQILVLLRPEHIVRSLSGRLHRADQLRIIAMDVRDEHGDPLFRDIVPEIYLAKEYNANDYDNLKAFGLQIITVDQFLDRFRADLLRFDSRFKAGSKSIAWHTSVVNVLCSFLDKNLSVQAIKQLEIIPLHSGGLFPAAWISASEGVIYYPDCGGVRVPVTLDLRVIDPIVCGSLRRRLWDKLGAQQLTPAMGISHITPRFKGQRNLTVNQVIDLLYFLFWHLENTLAPLDPGLWTVNTQNHMIWFMKSEYQHLYFPDSAGQFAARALLSYPAPSSFWNFLNATYLLQGSPSTIRNGRSWRQFLQEAVLVSDQPRLLKRGTRQISEEFMFIIAHRHDQLVGVLLTHRALYLPDIAHVQPYLRSAKVPVASGSTMELKDTVSPLHRSCRLWGSHV